MISEKYFVSISGLLCRSTTCDEKFSKQIEAVRVDRTAFRYGLRVFDWNQPNLPFYHTALVIHVDERNQQQTGVKYILSCRVSILSTCNLIISYLSVAYD